METTVILRKKRRDLVNLDVVTRVSSSEESHSLTGSINRLTNKIVLGKAKQMLPRCSTLRRWLTLRPFKPKFICFNDPVDIII